MMMIIVGAELLERRHRLLPFLTSSSSSSSLSLHWKLLPVSGHGLRHGDQGINHSWRVIILTTSWEGRDNNNSSSNNNNPFRQERVTLFLLQPLHTVINTIINQVYLWCRL
jgi:hypothetical protein